MLWSSLIIGAGCGVLYSLSIYIQRYFERPLVMSMERDFINWNTTFPGFTICSENTINETAMDEYLRFGAFGAHITSHLTRFDHCYCSQSKTENETPV